MIKRILHLATVLGALTIFFYSCSPSQKAGNTHEKNPALQSKSITSKIIDGVPHIYNPSQPQKDAVSLQLELLLKIDAMDIGPDNPVTFSRAFKAANGGIFLSDMKGYKIYEFNRAGKLLKSFLGRGDGPAELPFGLFAIQNFNENIWVLGYTKIIKFDMTRKAAMEIQLNNRYKNFEMPDETHFIGNFFKYDEDTTKGTRKRKCICALMDISEKMQVSLLEDNEAGDTHLEKNIDGQTIRLNFSNPFITPIIFHHLANNRKGIYIGISNQYTIYLKDLQGKPWMVIHKEYQHISLNSDEREAIAEGLSTGQPPQLKKMIMENLPPTFSAILDLQPLPNDYLAVYRISGLNKFEIDIFNPEGHFIYQITLPGDMANHLPTFYGNTLSVIRTLDDREIYEEYRVSGLPDFLPTN